MKPFSSLSNQLPKQGEVFYFPGFYGPEESLDFYKRLQSEIPWKEEPITIFGKKIMQPRLISWHGDSGTFYKYSGLQLTPEPWTSSLEKIKNNIENYCDRSFNSALLNLYRNQQDSNGWHSDDEKELGEKPFIASVSFGETRDFLLKHKAEKDLKVKISLEPGSLLIMAGKTQECWRHTLPKRARELGPRINLTFRRIL